MSDDETSRRQVTIPCELEEELLEAYPAARTVPDAIVMAAQDGAHIRSAYGSCFEDRVRDIVRDELAAADESVD